MNTEHFNAFTAHYKAHPVDAALSQAIADSASMGDMDRFTAHLWENGLCLVPAELPGPPLFSAEQTALLPLAAGLHKFGLLALTACINAHQHSVDFQESDFPLAFIVHTQDPRHIRLLPGEMEAMLETLIQKGLVLRHKYHFKLSPALIASLTPADAAQPVLV